MADTPTTPPTTPPAKKPNPMRDKLVPMVQHAFKTRGPVGGKAAFMGVPYWQRGQGVINPQGEWEQHQMLQDYRKRMKAQEAPKPDVPLPPLDPNTPQAAAPVAPPAAAPAAAPQSMADMFLPARRKLTPMSVFGLPSNTRKINGGSGGGGNGGGGAFGGGGFF